MKRALALAVSASLLIVGLVAVAPVSAGPYCGASAEFTAYNDTYYGGGRLGSLCASGGTAADANFNDSSGAFQTTDNDKMSSYNFQGKAGQTWCLWVFRDAWYGTKISGARSHNNNPIWVPSLAANDQASSVQIQMISYGQNCPSLP